MSFFNKVSDSAALVSGMAERLNVDFADRMAADPEGEARNFHAMVMRCTGCDGQEACRNLQENNLLLDEAPEYCRNRDVLRRA